MHPEDRIVTNIPKAQVTQAIRELEQSMEVDRAEISHYQILGRMLSATSVTVPVGSTVPMGMDFALREKDRANGLLQGLVRMEYDEINAKLEVVNFLHRLTAYAT